MAISLLANGRAVPQTLVVRHPHRPAFDRCSPLGLVARAAQVARHQARPGTVACLRSGRAVRPTVVPQPQPCGMKAGGHWTLSVMTRKSCWPRPSF